MRTEVPFQARVRLARMMVQAAPPEMPTHVRDQIEAAARDNVRYIGEMAEQLKVIEPDRGWRARYAADVTEGQWVYFHAALLSCLVGGRCPHARPDVPCVARLPYRRVDCHRCLQTRRKTVTANDECDVCGKLGVRWFTPLSIGMNATVLIGNACSECASVLLDKDMSGFPEG